MNKHIKTWLIIAVSLILAGCVVFVCVMSSLNWDFTKISTFKFTTNTHTVSETYANIDITTAEANVELIPSQDNETRVVCFEKTTIKHSVCVENNTIVISVVDNRQWYDYIGFSFTSPKVTVYLPQGSYEGITVKSGTGNVNISEAYSFNSMDISVGTGAVTSLAKTESIKVKSGTGNVRVKNSEGAVEVSTATGNIELCNVNSAADIKLNVATGNVSVRDVVCNNFTTDSSTGSINLSNVIATGKMSITASTGNVKFDKCDASQIYVKTSTGNVGGTLLTHKNFKASSDTGAVAVPPSILTAGLCEITVSTGNIKISIAE